MLMILSILKFGFFRLTRQAIMSIPPVEQPILSIRPVQMPSDTPEKIAAMSLYPISSPADNPAGIKV